MLSSPDLTGRSTTPRPLDAIASALDYWIPRFREGRRMRLVDAALRHSSTVHSNGATVETVFRPE
jgi:hypothetical protein